MSRAKKTKKTKQYSLTHRYRHITELLNKAKKPKAEKEKK